LAEQLSGWFAEATPKKSINRLLAMIVVDMKKIQRPPAVGMGHIIQSTHTTTRRLDP
jgi:hypothetical protein